jgi:iron(III) transport system substrate-binding protein
MKTLAKFSGVALIGLAATMGQAFAAGGEVNVYTYREPALIQPILDEFTKESGIKVNVIFAKDGLEQKILAEGANSPADMLLTVDIARLQEAEDIGITQPVKSDVLNQAVPETLRDPDNNWFALTMRARVVYASKERVQDTAITYEDLADPKWKGKICIRSGQHIYNNALFAAYLAKNGEAETEKWVAGIKNNLAQKPSGGDRDVAKDIAAGVCDVGLGNTYYVGLMTNGSNEDQKKWAEAIKVILPTFKTGNNHVNISGAAIAKNAPNRDNAVKLLEWMAGEKAQQLYANANYEYPVLAGVEVNPLVAGFGELKPDTLPMAEIAKNKKKAAEIVDKVAFDEGPAS